ncbi:MAG TPA: ROK family protein, partial [Actinokineospora sp.]|nr:ROK family protein [Actinokineospora sp.]
IIDTATLCDVDRVVIGGGVAAAGAVLFDPLRTHLKGAATLEFVRRVTVEPAALGRQSGLLGAARTALLARSAAATLCV